MAYTLYCAPDNASFIVRMALEEMGLPYESRWVDRSQGEQSSPTFLGLNPQGLLPVLVSDDLREPLFETGAILLWLAQKHQALWPEQAAETGAALKWLFFLSNTLHADLRALFYTHRYLPDARLVPPLREGLRGRVIKHFALLDREIAERGGPWLLGQTFTVCDLYAAMCARWARLYPLGDAMPQDAFNSLVQVSALATHIENRPAVRKALALEGLTQPDGACFSAPRVPQARLQAITGTADAPVPPPDTR
jgi:glutathione S-transferase